MSSPSPAWFHATVPGRRHCRSLVPSGNEQGVKGGRSALRPFHPFVEAVLNHGAAGHRVLAPPETTSLPLDMGAHCTTQAESAPRQADEARRALQTGAERPPPTSHPPPLGADDRRSRASGPVPRSRSGHCEHTVGRTNRAWRGWVGCCCLWRGIAVAARLAPPDLICSATSFPPLSSPSPAWFHATVPGRRHCRSLIPSGNGQG